MRNLLSPSLEYRAGPASPAGTAWDRRAARRFDMHCHSSYSRETIRYVPGLTFHPLLAPREVYELAKCRGMDLVTITDHDTIDGCKALLDEAGELPDFVVGEEVTVQFPEDGTIVHVNVYDVNEAQHAEMQRLTGSIYDLVHYLRRIDKLFVINHMTWNSQHRALQRWQIEAMLDLFDAFEAINGTRSYAHNAFTWYATHGRGKVLVAGSDSHTHRVGTTYTLTDGATRAEILANIRAGVAEPCGAFGTPEKLREDVWLTIQKNVERRMADATSAWERLTCRAVCRFGQAVHPLVCLGYHARQNVLIREFMRALPA